jgi:SAM-dependent methyltransferase
MKWIKGIFGNPPHVELTREPSGPVLGLNKPCELEDFGNPELAAVMRQIFPAEANADPAWPCGREDRKHWEVSMAVLAMRRELPNERRNMALGVGAGTEATSFYLTQHFRFVFATDLYARFTEWATYAPAAMLFQPEVYAESTPFERRRLVVQNMDAGRIDHEDETFDFIYSSSSIEHFGKPDEIRQAAREMGRVLKAGGVMAISTELCLDGKPGRLSGNTLIFSPGDIRKLIIEASGCDPVDEPSFRISDTTLAGKVILDEALQDQARQRSKTQRGWSRYPHIVLCKDDRYWTSYHLALRKPLPSRVGN